MTGKPRPELAAAVVAVFFRHRLLSEDILWGELRKTTRHVVAHAEARGFKIARALAASNNSNASAILLIPEFNLLPRLEQRVGPTVDRRSETRSFISSNRSKARLVWVDGEARVRLLQERRYTRLLDLLEDMAEGKSGPVGASEELAKGMARTARVASGPSLSSLARSAKWLEDGIREITSDAIGTSPS